MFKQAKSTTAKVRNYAANIQLIWRNSGWRFTMQFLRHISEMWLKKSCRESPKSKLHQAKLVTTSSSQGKHTYIQLDRANFKEKAVSSFLAADIPLHKLNHFALKSLFVAMGKPLPSETAACASVAQLASQKEENIRELLRNKKVFLIVDEAEVDKQTYISVLMGSLDTPNETFLVKCLPLERVAMLIAVLFYALWMTYCDNLGPNEKILYCS